MRNEWRYILNSRDCFIDLDGEVRQGDEMVEPFEDRYGHRKVVLEMETNEYDYERHAWRREREELYVWHLMVTTWFSGFPRKGRPIFLDGDPFNCAASNIRAEVIDPRTGAPRVIHVREESWGFVFDRRLRGFVENLETGDRYIGPSEAAKAIGGTRSGVSKVLAGNLNSHKGYRFRWSA